MPIGLLALALGGFGIGLTEFGIVGLLPEVASDVGVSEAAAGYLVSGYAIGVAVGAIALTAAVYRMERRKVLVTLMVLFILGNLISAVAPDYAILLLGRIVASLCHGAFFGIGAVVAADMVAPNRRAAAIALMFGGLTAANVFGVPLGTFLGQQLGWRSTFWAITIIGVISLVGIRMLIPVTPGPTSSLSEEFSILRRPQVWVSAIASVLSFGAVIGAFTYIAFTFTNVSGFTAASVPWLLVLFGVGTFAGNFIGGKLADRALNPSLIGILALLAVVLVAFALTAENQIMAIVLTFLLGTIGLATAPGLQTRMMQFAEDAPTVASGTNIAGFNVGNAIGAGLGGLTISAGLGFTSPLWVGAALAVFGVVVLAVGSAIRTPKAASLPNEPALVRI